MTTLDGEEHELKPSMLVIADGKKALRDDPEKERDTFELSLTINDFNSSSVGAASPPDARSSLIVIVLARTSAEIRADGFPGKLIISIVIVFILFCEILCESPPP